MCRGRRPRSAPTLATACPLCTPPPQTCRLCPCPRHAHDAWSLYTGRGRGQGEGARGAVRVRLIQPAHLPRHRDQISDHDVDDATPHSSFHGGTTHVARAHTPHSWRHNTRRNEHTRRKSRRRHPSNLHGRRVCPYGDVKLEQWVGVAAQCPVMRRADQGRATVRGPSLPHSVAGIRSLVEKPRALNSQHIGPRLSRARQRPRRAAAAAGAASHRL